MVTGSAGERGGGVPVGVVDLQQRGASSSVSAVKPTTTAASPISIGPFLDFRSIR
ncbi:hypothetical protein [Nonomuraea jabiensis]|uniref:hypothetical protein n=1 Tax=Nonomuraea jabiensis TaxID=882448 RepID=UPI003D746F79